MVTKNTHKVETVILAVGFWGNLRQWLFGFCIATVLVTIGGAQFLTSLRVYEWSDELDDFVLKKGYVHRKRDEGWARTHYGQNGFLKLADTEEKNQTTIMIWGDSYVEAHQVSDKQKTTYLLNRDLSARNHSNTKAVSVGRACWSIADYYFKIPSYDNLLSPVCHIIVLAELGLKDLCPDGQTFLTEPSLQFVKRNLVNPNKSKLILELDRLGLSDTVLAPWKAARTVIAETKGLRFSLGPYMDTSSESVARSCPFLSKSSLSSSHVVESWSYAINMLKMRTSKPLVFVLVPEVPYLEKGQVCYRDPQQEWRDLLVELCKIKQVGCIDMTEVLIDDYKRSHEFSRGFHNGRPGRGHLNPRGHQLLSQQIYQYLSEHPAFFNKRHYAVYTN